MTTTTEMLDATTPPKEKTQVPSALRATSDEIKAYAGIGVVAALWIGATLLFGFGGLITGALIMVVAMFVLLVIISRG